jgi:2-oxo-3-hexenedioate decarboxylase
MNDESSIERLTADLLQARATAQRTRQPSTRDAGFNIESGYRVGRALHARLVERWYRPVGRKIGFTNRALWEQLKVSAPIWAYVYEQTVHFAQAGRARLALDGMVAPRLEPEVVLKLREAVLSGDFTAEELAHCVEWAAVGFEIVDSHYPDWRFTAAEAVADFGVHAALVVGTPWRVESEDPAEVATALQTLKVTLRGGKDFFAEGEGRNTLGSPLLALGSLARVLANQSSAPPLMAGVAVHRVSSTLFLPDGASRLQQA